MQFKNKRVCFIFTTEQRNIKIYKSSDNKNVHKYKLKVLALSPLNRDFRLITMVDKLCNANTHNMVEGCLCSI